MKVADMLNSAVQQNLKPAERMCKLARLMSDPSLFDESDREKLTEVLAVPIGAHGRISNSDIYRILIANGVDVSLSVVDRHRNKECTCHRSALAKR